MCPNPRPLQFQEQFMLEGLEMAQWFACLLPGVRPEFTRTHMMTGEGTGSPELGFCPPHSHTL